MYYVINCSEDGDHSIEVLSKSTLEERLNENYYGDTKITHIPEGRSNDLNSFCGVLIISGELITPKLVKTVSSWEV